VEPSRVQRNVGALSLFIGIPIPIWRNRWICRACGHSWRPQPVPSEKVPVETRAAEERVHERRSYPLVALAVLVGLAVLYYVRMRIGS
jgi:hypothetical protein